LWRKLELAASPSGDDGGFKPTLQAEDGAEKLRLLG
jgi:hypothetical protein